VTKTCAIVVLNFNGRPLLEKSLPSLVAAGADEVVVLDNGSTDDSENFVRKNFPNVTWFRASANRFLVSYNEFLAQTKHQLVFLLNNDVSLRAGALPPLLRHFDDLRVFAVAPLVLNPGDHVENGRTCLTWSQGRFGYRQIDTQPGLSATASTAAGMYDREKLLSFGGFDELILPMYGEEMDLTLSAYRRGWIVRFEPKSVADHLGGASITKAHQHGARRSYIVNSRHLSVIKHVHSPARLAAYFAWMALLLPVRLVTFDGAYFRGSAMAWRRRRLALERRRREKDAAVVNDWDMFCCLTALGQEGVK
jgi:GT2 family glycosyltransferase